MSCGKGEENSNSKTPETFNEKVITEGPVVNCNDQKVVEVLSGGDLIVSRMLKEENRLLIWDLKEREEKASVYFPGAYYKMSPNGKYLLNRLSYRRFQLMIFSKNEMSQTIPLSFYSADNPDLEFSKDSKWLIIRYRPVSSRGVDIISFYDIENREFQKSIQFEDVRHVELSKDKKFVYIGIDKGRHKKIIKYDYENNLVVFETGFYSRGHFNKFKLLGDVLMAIDNDEYSFYDTKSSRLLYKKSFRYIYDSSFDDRYLLVAPDWNEMAIMDTTTGEILHEERRLDRVYASSCQLTSKESITCQDSSEVGKILEWNLKLNTVRESCY